MIILFMYFGSHGIQICLPMYLSVYDLYICPFYIRINLSIYLGDRDGEDTVFDYGVCQWRGGFRLLSSSRTVRENVKKNQFLTHTYAKKWTRPLKNGHVR